MIISKYTIRCINHSKLLTYIHVCPEGFIMNFYFQKSLFFTITIVVSLQLYITRYFYLTQAEKKKKKKFKPYTGRMRSPGLKVTESLEQTEMSLLTQEIMASMPPPQEKLTGLVTMPASCHSILKVR